jgi:hypothetical protein
MANLATYGFLIVTEETPLSAILWFARDHPSHVCLIDKKGKQILIAVMSNGRFFRYNCIQDRSSIKTAAFSDKVTKIAPGTFERFTSLETVSWNKEKTQVCEGSFSGCPFERTE